MKKVLITFLIFLSIAPQAFAEYVLFMSETCPHCNSLKEEMQLKNYYEEFDIQEYEVSENMDLYVEMSKKVAYKNGRVPLMIYQDQYFEGQGEIISFLKQDAVVEESSNILSKEEIQTIDKIVKGTKEKMQYQKFWGIGITIIIALVLIIIRKVFQLLHRKKGRGHH